MDIQSETEKIILRLALDQTMADKALVEAQVVELQSTVVTLTVQVATLSPAQPLTPAV